MKLETKVMIDGKTISVMDSHFPQVENEEEFELYAPQKGRAVEDVMNLVYEQKVSPKNLKSDAVVICYTVEEKYFTTYKVKMGLIGVNAEEI